MAIGKRYKMLKRDDFKMVEGRDYYSYHDQELEIMLEPCDQGFDVAAYVKGEKLGESWCTQVFGGMVINQRIWDRALNAANQMYVEYQKYRNQVRGIR